jgi:tRNA threonylcarbamoyladenosine biosynthesis protein TsaB
VLIAVQAPSSPKRVFGKRLNWSELFDSDRQYIIPFKIMSNIGFKADGTEPIILAVDTSSSEMSLAISSAENIVAALTVRDNRPHSQTLFLRISTLLQLAEIKIQEVDAFAVATGPGSFTGLRVGLAALKGLANSLDKPCLGVDSLDLLALASGLDGAHLVMINAGRGGVYCGLREVTLEDISDRSADDAVGKPSSVLRTMTPYIKRYMMESRLIVTGEGGSVYKNEVLDFIIESQKEGVEGGGSQQIIFLNPSLRTTEVLAKRVACLKRENQASAIRPHYIRRSDAEIKWT